MTTLDSKTPRRPAAREVGRPQRVSEAGQSEQQAEVHHPGGGLRIGGRLGRGELRRARLRGEVLLLPGLAAPRALDRRAGRDQRRQELPQRRRPRLPAVLRHHQGGGLPLPRSQRLPPRPGVGGHHRPVRGAWGPLRPRVRRPARQPLVRWRPGLAHVLRPGPDRPAAPARRLPGAREGDRLRQGEDVPAHRHARRRARRQGSRGGDHHPRHGDRRRRAPCRPRRGAGDRRLQQRLLPVDQCQGIERHRRLARPPPRRPVRQSLLHADPSDLHSGFGRLSIEADADVRVAAQRRADLGAQRSERQAPRRSRLPEADRDYFLERKYPSFGNLVPRDVAARNAKQVVRRGARRRTAEERRLSRLRGRHQAAGKEPDRRARYGNLFRDVREDHRRGPVRHADAHLPGPPLHDGRPVGRLQPDDQHHRPLCARRGELLGPRRQPPRRQRPDAGARRRLLRDPLHDRRLPLDPPRRGVVDRGRALPPHRGRGPGAAEPARLDPRQAQPRLVPSRARPHRLGVLRHRAQRRRAQ